MDDGTQPPERRLERILIQGLLARCIVGTKPDERESRQDVILDITLEADLQAACRSDHLEDTVDYSRLKKRVLSAVESSRDHLIERLAQRVADLCLEDPRVATVTVRVDKPGALRFARSVAVEIFRHR